MKALTKITLVTSLFIASLSIAQAVSAAAQVCPSPKTIATNGSSFSIQGGNFQTGYVQCFHNNQLTPCQGKDITSHSFQSYATFTQLQVSDYTDGQAFCFYNANIPANGEQPSVTVSVSFQSVYSHYAADMANGSWSYIRGTGPNGSILTAVCRGERERCAYSSALNNND